MSGDLAPCLIVIIEQHLQDDTPLTVAALGGIAAVAAQSNALAESPFLDALAELAAVALPIEAEVMDSVLLQGFVKCQSPSAVRSAIDLVIHHTPLCKRISSKLAGALEHRVERQDSDNQSLMAAYALEGLVRLALASSIKKFIPLKALTCTRPSTNGLYAQHAAKLAGVVFHTWPEPDLIDTLKELSKIEDAEGEASFELALINISLGLNADSIKDINQHLELASMFLRVALEADENRSDAKAYAAIIDIIRYFHVGVETAVIDERAEDLSNAVQDRALDLGGHLPDWLVPRADTEIQWARLIRSVRQACKDLARPGWLKASAVIDNLLSVFDADRTFATKGGLGQLLRSRIEASFVKERGQLALLDELLEEPDWNEHKETALALRARIAICETQPRKPSPEGLFPELRQVLRISEVPDDWAHEVLQQLEAALVDRRSSSSSFSNPVMQRLFAEVRSQLQPCQDYTGRVKEHFDELIAQVISFCKTRQDAGAKQLRDRGNYLLNPNATEFDLQQDLWQWLGGNYRDCEILDEVEGIGKGRADLFAALGGHRFVLEMKRHHGHLNRAAARKYCNQAATYQNTNVKLGFLGILELSDRTGPPPSLEECIWHEIVLPESSSVVRHLIVFRVPGNLNSPSSMSKNSANPRNSSKKTN